MSKSIAIPLVFVLVVIAGSIDVAQTFKIRRIPVGEKWMGVLGDSGTTGATQGNLQFKYLNIVKWALTILKPRTRKLSDYPDPHFFNITQPIRKLQRVYYSSQEKEEARERKQPWDYAVWQLTPIATRKIDVEEYTWAYMIGNWLGLEPDHIVMASENGSRVSKIALQVERLREVSDTLPQLVIGHFSANDFCSPSQFEKDLHKVYKDYYNTLRDNFKKVIQDSKPNPEGTTFLFLEPYNITEILTSPELLAQKVPFQDAPGGFTTCRDFHEGTAATTPKAQFLLSKIQHMCMAIFKMSTKETEKIIRLNQIQNVFINAFEDAINEANLISPPGFKWVFGKDFAKKVPVVQGDLSVDCFHPSLQLHTKVAKLVVKKFFHGKAEL